MAACLRRFCCPCASTEEKDYATLKENSSIRKLNNKIQKRKRKSTKTGTWTRRSLLMTDDADYDDVPDEEMSYQMKVINRSHDFEMSPQNLKSHSNQRRTAHEVFAGLNKRDGITSQTTIPNWMDENFVPNGRSAMRLGIRSVQINAKRNEIANRRSQELATQAYRYSTIIPGNEPEKRTTLMTDLLIKRNSSNQSNTTTAPSSDTVHDTTLPRSNVSNITRTRVTSPGYANVGHVEHSKTNSTPRPVSLSTINNKPLILKESQSDVGVRRIVPNTPGYRRSNPIPRLEDYTGGKLTLPTFSGDVPDGRMTRSVIETGQGNYHPYGSDQASEISYSSNITFKKSDISLKRENKPTLFHSSSFTNRQPKQRLPAKSRSNPAAPKTKSNYANPAESMYGYVPKIVRNVHASTVLEGNQIEDFFMQRMHDRELEKFATLNRDTEMTDPETVIVKDLVNGKDTGDKPKVRKTVPQQITLTNSDSSDTNTIKEVQNSEGSKEGVHSEQVASSAIPNWTTQSVSLESKTALSSSVLSSPSRIQTAGQVLSNTEEEEVIMIDFPPNLENDKPRPVLKSLTAINNGTVGVHNELDKSKSEKDRMNDAPKAKTDQGNGHLNSVAKSTTETEQMNGDPSKEGAEVLMVPESPTKSLDRPRIAMGVTRVAQRTDSNVSKHSTRTTTSSILESAEVLY